MFSFWKQKYTRIVALFAAVLTFLISRYLGISSGLLVIGETLSWQQILTYIFLIMGVLWALLVTTQWIWKILKLPQT